MESLANYILLNVLYVPFEEAGLSKTAACYHKTFISRYGFWANCENAHHLESQVLQILSTPRVRSVLTRFDNRSN